MSANQSRSISFFAFALITVLLISCLSKKEGPNPENSNVYGDLFDESNPIELDSLFSLYASKGEIENINVKGKVESVCKVKGCWMNIVSDDAPDKEVFVKFKDYGFFMPLDCDGKEVIMHGKAFIETTSVDELRHYAEDEGLSEDEINKITEPKEEFKFLADGVLLL